MHSIIEKYILDKIDVNIRIQKLSNAQQMSTQLVVYLVLSIPLYHSSQTFNFINTSPCQEHVFVLKPSPY